MDRYLRKHAHRDMIRLEELGKGASSLRPLIEQALADNHNGLAGDHDWQGCPECELVSSADAFEARGITDCLLLLLEGWPLDDAEECIGDIIALLEG